VQLCVLLSSYAPAKLALMEPGRPAGFRVDDFVPVFEVVIKATEPGDRARIAAALNALTADSAPLRSEKDGVNGAVRLAGIDEGRLHQTLDALRASIGEIAVGPPQIAYREQIMQRAEIDHTHKIERDGQGEFPRVKLVLEPLWPRDGVHFMGVRARTALGEDYIAAVERGIRSVVAAGVVAGFPVTGVRVLLVDGAFHDTDSSPLAFETAASAAFREALRPGPPVLLEPLMRLDIVTPEDCVDAIVQDLRTRRGYTDGSCRRSADGIVLTGNAPAANLRGYAASLQSISGGRARSTEQLECYVSVHRPDDPSFRPAVGMRA
jgi:elongation factor G